MAKTQNVKFGIFLLAGAVLVLAMVVLFARARIWESPDVYYVRTTDSVFGLEVGSGVYVRGVRVGSVDALRLFSDDFESVTIVMHVNEGVRINADAKAFLRLRGVTGLRIVDIDRGSAHAGILPPGSYVEHSRTAFDRMQEGADDMIEKASRLMATTERLIDNLAVLSEHVNGEQIDGLLRRADRTMANLEGATTQLEALIGGARRPLHRALQQASDAFGNVERITTDVEGVTQQMDQVAGDLRGVVRVNAADLRAMIANLREASQSLRQMSREIRERPSRLFFGGRPPERRVP